MTETRGSLRGQNPAYRACTLKRGDLPHEDLPFLSCRRIRNAAADPEVRDYISPMRLRAKGMTHAGDCCFDNRSRI